MNGREVYNAVYEGSTPDRPPLEGLWPWAETLERWCSEGLEPGQNPHEVLGLLNNDVLPLPLDLNMVPRYPVRLLRADEHYVIVVDEFGVTKRLLRAEYDVTRGRMANAGLASSMSQWLDFPVKDLRSWKTIYEDRFRPVLSERISPNWSECKAKYVELAETHWVSLFCFPLFGFFGPLRQLMGFERLMFAMGGDDPLLIDTIVVDLSSFWLEVFSGILADVRMDEAIFFEDIASTRAPIIGPAMFRRFLAPGYRKVIGGLHEMGVRYFTLDTEGDIRRLIPEALACGITGTRPVEVNAGLDVAQLRLDFPTFILNGGIDKRILTRRPAEIDAELAGCFAVAWEKGRYIPRLDNSAPPDIPWSNALHLAQSSREHCRAGAAACEQSGPWTAFLDERLGAAFFD
jgi:hypothetical protein